MTNFFATDSSVNNTENLSPSLTPPPSAPSKSPQSHQTYMPKDGNESEDDHEIIEEDDEDSIEGRNTENASPNSLQNKRKKKTRTVFSRAQVFQLESTFDLKRYLKKVVRKSRSRHILTTGYVHYQIPQFFWKSRIGSFPATDRNSSKNMVRFITSWPM